jgi:hypothetical protein
MKSSGEDFFASAPKQAALVKTSEIIRALRNVMFCKVVMLVKPKPRRIAASERGNERVPNWCLKKVLIVPPRAPSSTSDAF